MSAQAIMHQRIEKLWACRPVCHPSHMKISILYYRVAKHKISKRAYPWSSSKRSWNEGDGCNGLPSYSIILVPRLRAPTNTFHIIHPVYSNFPLIKSACQTRQEYHIPLCTGRMSSLFLDLYSNPDLTCV